MEHSRNAGLVDLDPMAGVNDLESFFSFRLYWAEGIL